MILLFPQPEKKPNWLSQLEQNRKTNGRKFKQQNVRYIYLCVLLVTYRELWIINWSDLILSHKSGLIRYSACVYARVKKRADLSDRTIRVHLSLSKLYGRGSCKESRWRRRHYKLRQQNYPNFRLRFCILISGQSPLRASLFKVRYVCFKGYS